MTMTIRFAPVPSGSGAMRLPVKEHDATVRRRGDVTAPDP